MTIRGLAMRSMRVGELAKRTGVSVRALHYYDEIGLLSPSGRTGARHRLYTSKDVARLQRIRSLQQLGFSLDEIRGCLDDPDYSPQRVVELHLAQVRERIASAERLRERLESIAGCLAAAEEVSVEEFVRTIEEMNKMDEYYTEKQRAQLAERRKLVGEDRIEQVEVEWRELFAAVRAEMDKGTDPGAAAVQKLVRRAGELVREFTGGDAGIQASLTGMWHNEPSVRERAGLDDELWEYWKRAGAAGRS